MRWIYKYLYRCRPTNVDNPQRCVHTFEFITYLALVLLTLLFQYQFIVWARIFRIFGLCGICLQANLCISLKWLNCDCGPLWWFLPKYYKYCMRRQLVDTRLNLFVFTAMLERLKIKVHFKTFVQEFKAQNGFSNLFHYHHEIVSLHSRCLFSHPHNEWNILEVSYNQNIVIQG